MIERRRSLPWFLSFWVVGGAFAFGCILTVLVFGVLWAMRPEPAPVRPATAVLDVIYAPTDTWSAPISSQATPTSQVYPSPLPGVIAVGAYVQVVGTGGNGLRLRAEPGLSEQVWLLANEAEVFQVENGPREVDGYTWWYLVGPYDETRRGWAVSNYLTVIQNP